MAEKGLAPFPLMPDVPGPTALSRIIFARLGLALMFKSVWRVASALRQFKAQRA